MAKPGAGRGGWPFGADRGETKAAPSVDLKALHAKIGELTLENDFLEGALTKAGLLSARR
jgi:transposase